MHHRARDEYGRRCEEQRKPAKVHPSTPATRATPMPYAERRILHGAHPAWVVRSGLAAQRASGPVRAGVLMGACRSDWGEVLPWARGLPRAPRVRRGRRVRGAARSGRVLDVVGRTGSAAERAGGTHRHCVRDRGILLGVRRRSLSAGDVRRSRVRHERRTPAVLHVDRQRAWHMRRRRAGRGVGGRAGSGGGRRFGGYPGCRARRRGRGSDRAGIRTGRRNGLRTGRRRLIRGCRRRR
jgi:hypothetical protein